MSTELPQNGLPWLSEVELEVRAQLTELSAHQLRTDRLLMDMQLEVRHMKKEITDQLESMGSQVAVLVGLVRKLVSNGHSGEGA